MSSASSQFHQLSSTQLDQLINQRACFKQRSYDTHTSTHQPQLESSAENISSAPQIDIVLLGDSMFERFKTTGNYTQIGQLHYPQVFNAGVGGDKIENVLYRVDLGLLRLLKPKNPKIIVLQLGTNNLQRKRGLERQHLDDYFLLLQALLVMFSTETRILVTGLFKRKDVDEQCIIQSNMALEELVTRVNTEEIGKGTQQGPRIQWMEPSKMIDLEHLNDNVHLNVNGYQIWNDILYLKTKNC
jgi:lysophospholipase L1-like esterase